MPNTATGCQLAEGDRATATEGRALGLPEQVTDAIRRHREGDRTALTDLVRIVSPWLQAVARGFGLSHYSAEDVAQTTLLALLRHVDTIRQPEAGLAWLAVTARHEATRVARAERAAELVPDLGTDEPEPPTSDPEAITMERLRRKLVWRHVAVLPDSRAADPARDRERRATRLRVDLRADRDAGRQHRPDAPAQPAAGAEAAGVGPGVVAVRLRGPRPTTTPPDQEPGGVVGRATVSS